MKKKSIKSQIKTKKIKNLISEDSYNDRLPNGELNAGGEYDNEEDGYYPYYGLWYRSMRENSHQNSKKT